MKKTVLVGVTSSIAAYKSVQLVSDLLKLDYNVEVVMTQNATKFIQPLTFSSLTHRKTYVDTFDRQDNYEIEHIELAKKADIIIIAPATANMIAKCANGIADDLLSTIFLAATAPKLIAPAMNTHMLQNPVTQRNLKTLRDDGVQIIDAVSGLLACGDEGSGKLASIPMLIDSIEYNLHAPKILQGKKVLISAGPTQEALDPVRFISNRSSGKMGYALAKAARNLGAIVTLVSGPTQIPAPYSISMVDVVSAKDMADVIERVYADYDIIIMAAAVADFTPVEVADQKLKKAKSDSVIHLQKTDDILEFLGNNKKKHQKLVGFAMETENVLDNAREKFLRKHCDLLAVNDLNEKGAGFSGDTNRVTFIHPHGYQHLDLMSKDAVAYKLFEAIMEK